MGQLYRLILSCVLLIAGVSFFKFGLFNQWSFFEVFWALGFIFLSGLFLYPFYSLAKFIFEKNQFPAAYYLGVGLIILSSGARLIAHLEIFNEQSLFIFWLIAFLPELLLKKLQYIRQIIEKIYKFSKETLLAKPEFVFLSLLAVFLLLNGMFWGSTGALYPPTKFDLSLSHLTIPKFIIENEGIVNSWWIRGSFIPQFVHMIYTAGIVWFNFLGLRGDLFPAIFSVYLYLFTFLSTQIIFKDSRLRIITVLVFLLFPLSRFGLSTAYIDSANTFIVILSLFSMIDYLKTKSKTSIILSMLFCTAAFCTKHFAAIYLLPSVFIIGLIFIYENRKKTKLVKNFLISITQGFPLVLLLLSIFFYFNFKLSGNPFFPFFTDGTKANQFHWDADTLKTFQGAIKHYKVDLNIKNLLKMPYQIGFDGKKFNDSGEYIAGPLWTTLMIICSLLSWYLIFFKKNRDNIVIILMTCAYVFTLGWFISSPVQRYLVPQVFVLATWSTYLLKFVNLNLSRIAVYLIIPFILIGPISYKDVLPPPISKKDSVEYLRTNFAHFKALEFIHKTKSVEHVYTFFAEGSWLYLSKSFLGDWFGQSHYGKVFLQKEDVIRKFFSERNIDHILFQQGAFAAHGGIKGALGDYMKCTSPVYEDTISIVYKINKSDVECYNQDSKLLPEISEYYKKAPFTFIPFWGDL